MHNSDFQSTELKLTDFIILIWKRRMLVISLALSFGIIGVAFSFSITKTYRAESTLIPAERYSGTMAANQGNKRLGSIMGLTSVGNETDYVVLGTETIKSRSFIKGFMSKNNLEPYYSAVDSYDLNAKKFIFNKDLYNEKEAKWSDEAYKNNLVPSDQALYKNFMKKTSFIRDMANNTLKLYTIHESPHLAKEVNVLLVKALNNAISDFDKEVATNSMNYIGERLVKTDGSELRQMLSGLYVSELEKKMLTEVQEEYVFRTLDPPVIPLNKYKPSRLQILISSILSGLFFSVIIVFFQGLKAKNKED